ncbi:ParA family protein [Saccharicrinis aurantiacus]|uniref:ParA family protein n=1 Tax=Saccharicrinis aurantiacus TaxID=1849719 RepID=UPI00094FF8C1|nr:ParA family protein [Saccharicrinis aurantiacus]
MNISDQIRIFLRNNPSLSISGLEKEAGITDRNLSYLMHGRVKKIKAESLESILSILKKYGFEPQEGAKVISIVNNKGGVSKTTLTANIGRGLAERGYKVLLIDNDPQGSLTDILGTYSHTDEEGEELYHKQDSDVELYNCMLLEDNPRYVDPLECRYDALVGGRKKLDFHIIPSTLLLQNLENELTSMGAVGSFRLDQVLKKVSGEYDFVLIDNPPAMNILVTNAILASDSVLIPVQPEKSAVQGIVNLIKFINLQSSVKQGTLSLEGLLFTLVKANTMVHKTNMAYVREHITDIRVLETKFSSRTQVPKSVQRMKTLYDDHEANESRKEIESIIKELL